MMILSCPNAWLEPCHAGDDQALNKQCELLLMFRQYMRDSSAKARTFRMRDDQFALDNALNIQLALNADGLIFREWHFCGKVQPSLGNVYDLTDGRGVALGHEAAP
jgi:hypothetical protein